MTTQVVTFRAIIPKEWDAVLDDLSERSWRCVDRMMANRQQTSTRFYPEIPSVIAKSLSTKYQRNPKCHKVTHLSLPICGERGEVVKIVEGGLRLYRIFKNTVIPCQFPLPVSGFIRRIELFKRAGRWFMSYTYNTPCAEPVKTDGCVGVDRNSVGNVAVLADPQNGKARHFGFNPARTKACWKRRKRKLQKQGKHRLLHRIGRKQARRTKYENHLTAKQVVDYAAEHRRAIVLEKLEGVRKPGSNIRSYSEKNDWSFAQLSDFIRYKAALRGVPVLEVDPAYTSQECSRCGSRHKPDGKSFQCPVCGHQDHRDSNAAFVIAKRGNDALGGLAGDSVRSRCGLLVVRESGKGKAANA
jgi:putative transposase